MLTYVIFINTDILYKITFIAEYTKAIPVLTGVELGGGVKGGSSPG